jgi:hypothetical protein
MSYTTLSLSKLSLDCRDAIRPLEMLWQRNLACSEILSYNNPPVIVTMDSDYLDSLMGDDVMDRALTVSGILPGIRTRNLLVLFPQGGILTETSTEILSKKRKRGRNVKS